MRVEAMCVAMVEGGPGVKFMMIVGDVVSIPS